MKPQDRRSLVCTGFALLTVLLAGAAQAAPLVAIAEERLEPSQLVLQPLFEFEKATLTVEGPGGYIAERAFLPGEAVRLALIGSEGRALPNGRYKYFLRLASTPAGTSESQQGLFYISGGSGISRTERRDRLASIREDLHRERQRRLESLLKAAAISRDEVKMAVTPPYSYALSIDGDFALDGYVFKEGMPFIHNYGGSYYGNTALGIDALLSVTPDYTYEFSPEGLDNTAIGKAALRDNTIGNYNTAIGRWALGSNTTGSSNTAVGRSALGGNTTGSGNTAVGRGALHNTTGYGNTAFGRSALTQNSTGSSNTAIGAFTLHENITGRFNTAVGDGALGYNTSGWRNVAFGYRAGYYATTGDDNIFIANSGVAGDSGSIRIGTQGTHGQTYIAGIYPTVLSEAAGYVVTDADGQLGVQAFVSSHRYKEGIADIGEASERLMGLRPAKFRFKKGFTGGDAGVHFGLIAEEVAEVFPELVTLDAEGRAFAVKYRFLPPLLLNELQKQDRRIHGQEKLLAAQERLLREQQETLLAQDRLLAEQRRDFERLLFEQRRELEALANRLARLEGFGRPPALEARGRPRPSQAPTTP